MADRYWVGGSGTWDATTTTNWSANSGGAGGASAPTSADNVIFDANSNTLLLPFTVTVAGTLSAPSVSNDFTASGLDGAMTLAFGSTGFIQCYGSMAFPATNFSITNSGSFTTGIIFSATTTGKTFTTNGVSVGSSMLFIFDGVGGEWTLGSALTTNNGSIDLRAGSFKTGNYNYTGNTLSAISSYAANTRAITLGSSTITLIGGASPMVLFGGGTLTFNADTSTIIFSTSTATLAGGGFTFYNVSFTSAAAGTTTISGANTFNNLTQTSRSATGTRFISFAADQTVSGTLTLGAANTAIRRIIVLSSVIGTQRTITLNGTLAALADVDFRDINAAGTVATPWTGTRLGDCLGNANITFDAAKTVYWNLAGTQNWSATGWATTNNGAPAVNNFPLAQDTATFTEAGAAGTVTIDAGWNIGNIQMADGVSNRTTAFTFATGTAIFPIYGNVTLFSSLTLSGTGRINFNGQGATKTITSASISFTQPFTIEAPSGTFQLSDNLTNTSALGVTLTQGTLDLNDFDLTCNIFSSSNTNTRAIDFGTGKIQLTGNSGTVLTYTVNTGITVTGTKLFEATYSGSTGTRNFAMGSISNGATEENSVNLSITAGTDTVDFSANRVLNSLNFTGFAGTLISTAYSIYGDLTISSGMTLSSPGNAMTFAATSGTKQITTAGKTINFGLLFNGVGGAWAFQDALTQGSTHSFGITNGTVQIKAATNNSIGTLSAASGNSVNLQTTTDGTKANITALTTTPIYATNLTVKDCWVSPGGIFNAYTGTGSTTVGAASSGCVNAGNNQGWYFTPSSGSFFF
jgi:hypothetical protein